jgi:hypothetical protein
MSTLNKTLLAQPFNSRRWAWDPLGSGICGKQDEQGLGRRGVGWRKGKKKKKKRNRASSSIVGPWGQTPTGPWRFPVVDHPPTPRTNSDSVCGWSGKKEESRSIRAGYLARSHIRTEIRMNCYGKGVLHSGASFILHLAQEMVLLFFSFLNRHIYFIKHAFCRLMSSPLKRSGSM